jgi:hypothetical protein
MLDAALHPAGNDTVFTVGSAVRVRGKVAGTSDFVLNSNSSDHDLVMR